MTTYRIGVLVGSLSSTSVNRRLATALARLAPSERRIGTAVCQQHLRSVLGFCNAPQMSSPEAYIQFTPDLVDESGEVTDTSTERFLREYLEELRDFVVRVLTVLPRTE